MMLEICHTGVYTAHQAFTAMAAGADYAAPYLGRMNDAGKNVGSASGLCLSVAILHFA